MFSLTCKPKMELKMRLALGFCVVLLMVVSPSLGYTACNATPMKIGLEICIGCQPGNVTASWPPGSSQSGWLPLSFKYNERQYAITLRAVDDNGEEKTFKLSTMLLALHDVGRYEGALVKGSEINEFLHWPITVLNSMTPGTTFNETCWTMGSKPY
mgnify:CR=1 FL=1